jgi:hypothetical protein
MTRPLAERTAPRRSTAPVDGRRRDSQGEKERRREGDANEESLLVSFSPCLTSPCLTHISVIIGI